MLIWLEENEFLQAWHYRNSEQTQGHIRARELYEALSDCTAELGLHVLNGNKVIEVRARGINKGTAVSEVLDWNPCDFFLAVGDDVTDEDMFIRLAKLQEACTIKVGPQASFAK